MAAQLLQGNEACALGALAAGCRLFAGYPITPSTEIAEVMARELHKVGDKFIQMEDEIASIAAVLGATVGGVTAMTATSSRPPVASLRYRQINGTVDPPSSSSAAARTCRSARASSAAIFRRCVSFIAVSRSFGMREGECSLTNPTRLPA